MEDDAERVARAGEHAAHPVADGRAVETAGALGRPVACGEDHELALLGGDRLAARLGARPLLEEQEIAARVVHAAAREEARQLERKHDVAVEVLVEAVIASGLVVEQERRRLGLPAPPAERLERREVGRV